MNVGNGQWHNISVVRERTQVTLSVDSDGDGYSVTGIVVTRRLLLFSPRIEGVTQSHNASEVLHDGLRDKPLFLESGEEGVVKC